MEQPTLTTALDDRRAVNKSVQILDAAARVFRAHGYADTTMDAVARAANVSKATLYAYFSGKRELFAAIVRVEGDRNSQALLIGEHGREDLRVRLQRFGRVIVDLLTAPETVASYRMVAAEAQRHPDLARDYYANGAARLLDRVESVLGVAMAQGSLRVANPRRAAEQFIGLVRGDLQLRALLGLDGDLTGPQKDAVVRAGVDVFCRAYLVNSSDTSP